MDGGSSLNLIYEDTVRRMRINPSRSEELLFTIAPFQSGYHALLGRTAFARFNALPHYVYLTLKMPGPRGVITVSNITERSSRAEEHATALAAGL